MSDAPNRPDHPLGKGQPRHAVKHPLKHQQKQALKQALKLTTGPAQEAGDAATASDPAKSPTPQVAGDGRPYITLAQFLKKIQAAGSGGEAKAMARSGIAKVNGEAEARPGRKLFAGDRVTVAGTEHRVDLAAP